MENRRSKTSKQIERHFKGAANHYRIEILLLIAQYGTMTLEHIVERIGASEKTLGEHTRRLHRAGLINKKYRGRFVDHELSPYGRAIAQLLQSFKNIK